ncbi:hypothetical protein CVU75_02200 [Candidatus Dependentiae bacterium HGW-Dependentiae-1]|nr:MAG: hypothetical protein CVU75_02200 [Candidatus Dependentiae bacterium HGW-Dependentiae-1]
MIKNKKNVAAGALAATLTLTIPLVLFRKKETHQTANPCTQQQCTAYLQHANTLHEKKDYAQAASFYMKAIKTNPKVAQAHYNLGLTLEKLDQNLQALAAFRKAIEIDPHYLNAHLRSIVILQKLQRYPEAQALLEKALALDPNNPTIHLLKVSILYTQGQLDSALSLVHDLAKKHPQIPQAHVILGAIYEKLNDFQNAYNSYTKAIALEPNNPKHHVALADACIGLGNYSQWSREYEWRWQSTPPINPAIAPLWDGSSLKNKKILVVGENGFGDTIQFIRFVPYLKKQGAYVIVQAQKPLKALFSLCTYIDQVITKGDPIPSVDCMTSVMSLPYYFPITQKTIPNKPFLTTPISLTQEWKKYLAQDKKFKVGLCWQASAMDACSVPQARRTMCFELMAKLTKTKNVSFYSLQKEWPREQLKKYGIKDFGADFDVSHGAFMDSAAIMKNIDLIITVDTVTAHLAGALNVPVWVLTPVAADPRWMLNRSDTPWYPSMTFFRQKKMGDWESVIQLVSASLEKKANKNLTKNDY